MDKRIRSPNYPGLNLKEAVERARAIASQLGQRASDRDSVAIAMGYRGITGTSATAVSALNKYGLLEGRGEEIRLSDLAMSILHPSSEAEKRESLRRAAMEPSLFKDIYDRFGDASNEDLLRNYLLRNKFAPSAVDAAISAYRETVEFVGGLEKLHDSDVALAVSEPASMETTPQTHTAPPSGAASLHDPDKFEEDKTNLDEGPARLVLPRGISPESVEELDYWIQGVMRRLKRRAGSQPRDADGGEP